MSAIGKHIEAYLERNGMRLRDLAVAMGYTNLTKGNRKLARVITGEISDPIFMSRLGQAMGDSEETFKAVMDATNKENADEQKRLWALKEVADRAAFTPYVYVEHEKSVPSSICIIAFVGLGHWKDLALPNDVATRPEDEQLKCVREAINHHKLHGPTDHFFGKVTGYAYRRTYDEYVRVDLKGMVLGVFQGKPQSGIATLEIGNKVIEKMPGV